MDGRMRPYLPELTIRDYNIYQWYLRGVQYQLNTTYGLYSCSLLQHNGVLFALLSDSLAGRVFYLLDKAGRVADDKRAERYNVYLVNGVEDPGAALENARRQSLAAANDLVRAYGMLDVKLNKSLIDNIMILGLRHAVEPLDPENQPVRWELP